MIEFIHKVFGQENKNEMILNGFTNTTYFTPEFLKAMIKENNDISFSVLHLNVRSLNKNFENLKNLLV